MSGLFHAFKRRYGAGPGHLLATFASFLLAAAAVIGWFHTPGSVEGVLTWFAAAVLLHDVVFLPVYSLLDRVTIGALPARTGAYVRVPAIISGLLMLTLFPTLLGLGAHEYHNTSGLTEHGYLLRWLVLSGALFALSGAAWSLRGRRTLSD